jgi:hypothetical protein
MGFAGLRIGKGAEAPLRQRNVSARFADLGVQRPGIAGCGLGEDWLAPGIPYVCMGWPY